MSKETILNLKVQTLEHWVSIYRNQIELYKNHIRLCEEKLEAIEKEKQNYLKQLSGKDL